MADNRAQWLLGDDLRQDDVVVRVGGIGGAGRVETRRIGRKHVAATGEEGGARFLDLLDDDRLEGHLVGAEIVGEVELGRRAGLYTDRGAVQLLGALHAELLVHHEALAIVVVDAGEVEAEGGVARQGVGRGANQKIHFARLQGGEALLRGGRDELDLVGIAKDRRGDGAADIDIDTGPLALAVGSSKPGDAGADATEELPACLDSVELLASVRRRGDTGQRGRGNAGGQELLQHVVFPRCCL